MPINLAQSFRIDPADLPSEAVIFGSTAAMNAIRNQIECVAQNNSPVLIEGESGTGKELIARFLHVRSSGLDGPFVKVNCAAGAAGALERELLGREGGTCPGVDAGKRGLAEIAEGGTLFLTDIGEMDWALQSRLLRLMEAGGSGRDGGRAWGRASFRVICATKVELSDTAQRGIFRQELIFGTDTVRLRLLALRERREDIPQLWNFCARKLAARFNKTVPELTPVILNALQNWDWPGNIRELENCIARIMILGEVGALSSELGRQTGFRSGTTSREATADHLKDVCQQTPPVGVEAGVLKVLQANHWNKRKAAEELKMSYRSLVSKLRDAGVPRRRRSHGGFPHSL